MVDLICFYNSCKLIDDPLLDFGDIFYKTYFFFLIDLISTEDNHGLFKRDWFLVNYFFYMEAHIITLRILLYKAIVRVFGFMITIKGGPVNFF